MVPSPRSWRKAALDATAVHVPPLAALMVRVRAVLQSPESLATCRTRLFTHCNEHGRSLQCGRSPLDDAQPWIQFGARDYVVSKLRSSARVLEFGSGGSTLFWLSLGASVTSVEHDPAWGSSVREQVIRFFGEECRAEIRVVPPDRASSPAAGQSISATSTDPRYAEMSFDHYVRAAEDLPKGSVDLLVVDGRARSVSLTMNLDKVRTDGMVLLDNSDRLEYQEAMEYVTALGWQWHHFDGPVPYLMHFSRTSVAIPSTAPFT